jgi:hypothetical protein
MRGLKDHVPGGEELFVGIDLHKHRRWNSFPICHLWEARRIGLT